MSPGVCKPQQVVSLKSSIPCSVQSEEEASMLGFCIFAFSIGLPVWPWLFHRTSFPSFPVPAEQGVQGTETKPQQ